MVRARAGLDDLGCETRARGFRIAWRRGDVIWRRDLGSGSGGKTENEDA
jgi:hypothetical protein